MFNPKFSLQLAYANGFRIVLNYFSFFLFSIGVGGIACAISLIVLGVIDFNALRYHMAPLLKMFHHVFDNFSGALHYQGTTIHEIVKPYLSSEIAQQTIGRDIVSIDASAYDFKYLLSIVVPTMLVLKLFVDMIAIGWTKIALDLIDKKSVSVRYLFQYYYLVPRVFLVSLIVGILTTLGTILFIIPGIFVYERLRFSRYFIIDKNLSIIKALQASWSLTEKSVFPLFGFTMVAVVVESISNVLVVAYLFLTPLQNQVEADVYRQLIDAK